ncbi:MAG: ABC transporter permease [Bacteroidota bacterium]
MRKLWASIKKEFLVLFRDRAGLAILFLMPAALVVIMTLLQDATFKTVKQNKFTLVVADLDKDTLSQRIIEGLEASDHFRVVTEHNNSPINATDVKQLVAKGTYKLGLVIPAKTTAITRHNAARFTKKAFGMQTPKLPFSRERKMGKSTLTILVDPVTSESFKQSLTSAIQQYASKLQIELFFEYLSAELADMLPQKPEFNIDEFFSIEFTEEYATSDADELLPNSVQHNVPAWTLFAIFFIVLPLGSNMIKERNDGSMRRIRTMPVNYMVVLMGKISVFMLVAVAQFLFIVAIGKYLFPYMDLPVLELHGELPLLFAFTLVCGFTATAYGVLLGTVATTHDQAATFGAVSIIMLAAIGGIWVPVYVMPDIMQNIAELSPMRWGLVGYYNLLIRGNGLQGVLPSATRLITLGVVFLGIAHIYFRRKHMY